MSRLFKLGSSSWGALSPLAFVPLCRDRAGGVLARPKAWVLHGHVKGCAGSELGYFVSWAGKCKWWYPGLYLLPDRGSELQVAHTSPEEPKKLRSWSLLYVSGIQQLSAVACRKRGPEEFVLFSLFLLACLTLDYEQISGGAARTTRKYMLLVFWVHAFFRKFLVAHQSKRVKQSLLYCRNEAHWRGWDF